MLVKQFPDFGEYDVVVARGGVAGFAAGVSAARNGAKTLIVEQNGFLGGTATAGMVGQMIGFAEGQMGIAHELAERLSLLNATDGYVEVPLAGSDIYVKKVNYDPEVMKMTMDAMVLEAGAEILFHSKVIDVSSKDNSISGIIIHNCSGYQLIKGKVFVDAVAVCSYPMDEHDPSGAGIKYLLPQEGKYYIPFRCLVTDQVKNLILAGRCISATYEAHASLRVMPICLALGQAAGLGAVLSLHREENVNQLDGSLVSRMLFGTGGTELT